MNAPTFSAWVRRRDDQRRQHVPYADQVVPLVAHAGAVGLTRTQLGHAVRLERDTLDQLLGGLVQAGILTVGREYGAWVYRTTGV